MDIKELAHWRSLGNLDEDGVMVASSRQLEVLLPWWWLNYRLHNALPVVFVSFDMSKEALAWCRKRGEVIELEVPEDFIAKRESIDPFKRAIWEKMYGETHWNYRSRWVRKPFALLQSPYKRTIWFDLDCQIRKPISHLFEACENPAGIAVVVEPEEVRKKAKDQSALLLPGEKVYNSGVLAYKRHSPLIEKWIDATIHRNAEFYGDQEILSRIIHEQKPQFKTLPVKYNWLVFMGMNKEAAILHWAVEHKYEILDQIEVLTEVLNFDLDH